MAISDPEDIRRHTVACTGVDKPFHSLLKLKTETWEHNQPSRNVYGCNNHIWQQPHLAHSHKTSCTVLVQLPSFTTHNVDRAGQQCWQDNVDSIQISAHHAHCQGVYLLCLCNSPSLSVFTHHSVYRMRLLIWTFKIGKGDDGHMWVPYLVSVSERAFTQKSCELSGNGICRGCFLPVTWLATSSASKQLSWKRSAAGPTLSSLTDLSLSHWFRISSLKAPVFPTILCCMLAMVLASFTISIMPVEEAAHSENITGSPFMQMRSSVIRIQYLLKKLNYVIKTSLWHYSVSSVID